MRAAVLTAANQPLKYVSNYPIPKPLPNQILVKVSACGVCRTDLHVYDGDLTSPKLPLILGHEIVGRVVTSGAESKKFKAGDRIGTGWLAHVDGSCRYCKRNQENLCDHAVFTGYTRDGGFAEYCVVDEEFAEALPPSFDDVHAAPLMCAGLIGFRTYKMTDLLSVPDQAIGIYGFGAAAHICAQLAPVFKHRVFAFTRPGDTSAQEFARSLGCEYAGDSSKRSPEPLDAALIFAAVGDLVVNALENVRKGGIVVCGGIHMSDIPSFPYASLWGERTIKSVANLKKDDLKDFLNAAALAPHLTTAVTPFPLEQAQDAIEALKAGKVNGAAVITMD